MTRNNYILLAAGGSLGLVLLALGFQHIGGVEPCKMCYWQRYPHYAAVVIGLLALLLGGRLWIALGALAAATTMGLGAFHTGVERKWWEGPQSCTGDGGLSTMTGSDLLDFENTPLPVMCDDIAWDTWGLGITMANWNVVISLLFVLLWLRALRKV